MQAACQREPSIHEASTARERRKRARNDAAATPVSYMAHALYDSDSSRGTALVGGCIVSTRPLCIYRGAVVRYATLTDAGRRGRHYTWWGWTSPARSAMIRRVRRDDVLWLAGLL